MAAPVTMALRPVNREPELHTFVDAGPSFSSRSCTLAGNLIKVARAAAREDDQACMMLTARVLR